MLCGSRLYYQYVPEGKEYPVLSRRLRSSGGLARAALDFISGSKKEQVLLDWNEIAEKFGVCYIYAVLSGLCMLNKLSYSLLIIIVRIIYLPRYEKFIIWS